MVIGRPRAGSLIAEFLLTAANVEYEFKNISIEEAQQNEFKSISPFSKIPVLVCPDGQTIFETVAIVTHLICLLYTSPSPRDSCASRMPSSA